MTSDRPVIAFSAGDPSREDLATGQLVLMLGGEPTLFALTVPSGPTTAEAVLPILHGFSDLFAARGAAADRGDGREVSCRAGCGACCRQMVPVAGAEALALARLVEAMPEPRRSIVHRRFDTALAALDRAGILERISDPEAALAPEMGRDYFRAGVACPFLEGEACSIYHDRPLICREYLVTSPPANCADPGPDTIDPVPLDGRPSQALIKAEPAQGWTALVLALRLAEQTAPVVADRSGPEILRGVLGRLSG